MARYDFNAQRLFVEADLAEAATVACSSAQANYLQERPAPEGRATPFSSSTAATANGGPRSPTPASAAPRCASARRCAPQEGGPDIDYLFAPLKRARLDYMVQKATEMGVARLRPVLTRRTTPERVNVERMHANAIEAAEQCGILRIPEVHAAGEARNAHRRLGRGAAPRSSATRAARTAARLTALARLQPGPLAVADRTRGRLRRRASARCCSPAIRDAHLARARASCAPIRPRSPLSPS